MYRYFRLLSEETIGLKRIKIHGHETDEDLARETLVSATSLEDGYGLKGLVTDNPSTYRSVEKRGIDNRRENNMDLNVIEVDIGMPVKIKDIILEIPHDMQDSWKLAYCSWQLLDEHRRILCASEVMFHHWGRREIRVNNGHIMPFTFYPTRNMIEASKIKITHIQIPVDRYPKWNTIQRGGSISLRPKLYIDYPDLIYMGSLFHNVGYIKNDMSFI